MEKYRNRQEAGKLLARALSAYQGRSDVIVLGLPRGGVPVAYEVAKALHLPLDVFIVRKIGVPSHPELAMGAIAMGGARVFNQAIIDELGISEAQINRVIATEQLELQRREQAYRGDRPFPSLINQTVILVDDGIATGATMRAAIQALRALKAAAIVVAVPCADKALCDNLAHLVDDLCCPLRPTHFYAVGAWYDDFAQTEDEEVYDLLTKAAHLSTTRGPL